MPDTHEDIRRRLFDAAWETPAFAPATERTVARARRRATTTIGAGALAVVAAIVIAAASLPLGPTERTAGFDRDEDPPEFLVDVSTGETTRLSPIRGFDDAAGFDVSPTSSRMVFASDTEGAPALYLANLYGSGVERLTRGFLDMAEPSWSPDGKQIAFVGLRDDERVRNVFVADVEIGRVRRITMSPRDVHAPEWTLDGRSVVYTVSVPVPHPDAPEDTFMLTDLSAQLRIVDVRTRQNRKLFGGTRSFGYDGSPSPEGVVFIRGRGLGDRGIDLAVLASDETRPITLLEIEGANAGDAWWPMVSPDGSMVAYVRAVGGDEFVFLFDMATGESRELRRGFFATWVDDDTLLIQDDPETG
jgi:Tol biopolymer transport system component